VRCCNLVCPCITQESSGTDKQWSEKNPQPDSAPKVKSAPKSPDARVGQDAKACQPLEVRIVMQLVSRIVSPLRCCPKCSSHQLQLDRRRL